MLVAQCTCKAIENFIRAPRDESPKFSNLQPGTGLVISSMRRIERYQIYGVARQKCKPKSVALRYTQFFLKWETEPGICENLKNLASRWQAVPLIFKRSKRLCVRKTREFSCNKMRTTDAHRTSNQNQACGCSTCRSQCPEHEDNFLFEIGLKLTELRGITLLRAKATLSHLESLLGYISKIHWLDRCPHLLCTTCKKPHANIF